MAQIYKIYVNESALIIADLTFHADFSYKAVDSQSFDFLKLYRKLQQSNRKQRLLWQTAHPAAVFRKIRKQVTEIRAAGGLVLNSRNEMLFIYRLGTWDLPKGKIDPGEKAKETAVREIEEECGVRIRRLTNKLLHTYHMYQQRDDVILKRTDWYRMTVDGVPELTPQTEEDITEARWFGPDELDEVKANTYPAIIDVLDTYQKLI